MADNENTPDSGTESEGAAPDPIKQFEDIAARVSNKAATAQLSRFVPSFKKEIMAAWDETLAPIRERLDAMNAGVGGNAHKAEDNDLAKLRAENAKLAASIQALNARAQKAEEEKQAEQSNRMRQEEDRAVLESLAEAGVTGKRAQAVALLLRQEAKAIKRDENGAVVFEVAGPGGYPDHLPVGEGVKRWLESEGKEFLPPRVGGGSGSAAPTPRAPAARQKPLSEMSPDEQRKARLQAAWSRLSGKPVVD